MLGELGLPTVGSRALTEVAGITRKRGGKGLAIVLELVGVSGVSGNVVAESSRVVGGATGQNASKRNEHACYVFKLLILNSRHIKRDEQLESGTRLLRCSIATNRD